MGTSPRIQQWGFSVPAGLAGALGESDRDCGEQRLHSLPGAELIRKAFYFSYWKQTELTRPGSSPLKPFNCHKSAFSEERCRVPSPRRALRGYVFTIRYLEKGEDGWIFRIPPVCFPFSAVVLYECTVHRRARQICHLASGKIGSLTLCALPQAGARLKAARLSRG